MHLRELDANLIVILDALLMEASVTRAAERLGRSPSAVSHALARLRDIFDDPLFVRAGQRLVPTSRANQIAPTVHIIVSGLEGLLYRQHLFDAGEQQRRFVLSCRDAFELTMLPALRAKLAEAAPGITLERGHLVGGGIVEALRNGHVDLAVVEGCELPEARDISRARLCDDPLVMLAPEGHPARQAAASGTRLTDAGALIAEENHAGIAFDACARPRPGDFQPVASALIAAHAAIEHAALALVPASIAPLAERHMGMRRVNSGLALGSVSVEMMWHVSQERDACHGWLRDQLRLLASDALRGDGHAEARTAAPR